jgi:hypothetical protein
MKFFQIAAQASACDLHLKGLRHSSGRSIIAHCKRTYGFRGTNQYVTEQMNALVAGALAAKEYNSGKEIDLQAMVNAYQYGELQAAFIRGAKGEF